MTTDKIRKDKNQNIQVFIRLRPLNQRERDIKSLGVVEVVNNREVLVRQSQQTSHTKKFTFDRAFGPNTAQLQVYQEVVSPLIVEVLAGYNCTVFAYGQTGTGKTHTMVGEHLGGETTWQTDPLAGIIPRALSQLFDELRLTNTEYTVRVSYLELYNEELFDLLATSEDNSKLRIYEDVTRKGSNIVNGLEEITVYSKNEVYKIMEQGQERKRVASTLMNAQSSRSHTVFTIVVHMKENSPEGEELVKIGKLNLVDLAGSENISKAGSDNPAKRERARECVNINQSLLTLGRVITALVERHPHIPYRESKLTRILQESLGGRTKTSIIATISPGHKDLEETMSTLEYAHRAKNIQNKPEINQKMTKKAILKEYAEEIDRLKRDLTAARDKNGVYLASETFAEMTMKQEEQNKEIQELLLKKRAMEDERSRMEGVFHDLSQTLEMKNTELANTKNELDSTQAVLASTSNMLVESRTSCLEQQHLVQRQQQTEAALARQARELLATADVATKHVACLHDTVDKRKSVESTNLEVTQTYRSQAAQQRDGISAGLRDFTDTVTRALDSLQAALDTYTTTNTQTQEQNKNQLECLVQAFIETVNEIKSVSSESYGSLSRAAGSHSTAIHSSAAARRSAARAALTGFLQTFAASLQHARDVDVKGNVASFVQQWHNGAAARVSSLQRAHSLFESRAGQAAARRARADASHRAGRRAHVARRANNIRDCMADMEEETRRIEKRLAQQLTDIETERRDTEVRLEEWVAEERKALEERLAKHIATEKQALEQRLTKKITELEEDRKVLEDRMARYRDWEQMQLDADKEEMEMMEEDLVESGNVREEFEKDVKKYGKAFEEGTNAVSVDMEVFSKNVVEVVEHINNEMLRALQQTNEHVQQEVSTVLETDEATSEQFVQAVDSTLAGLVDNTKQILDQLVTSVEAKNTAAIQSVTNLAASTSELISLSESHAAAQRESCAAARGEAASCAARLCEAVHALAELEARCLKQEYKVYSPTGKTPARAEYRYPRLLAATSPHARVLARFRAMQQEHHDEDNDCVVVDDSEQRSASESECSAEESAVFAAPATHSHIVKSTSETDIYAIRKQQEQGKENANRSISHKKPSKLPAPASHKKPLVERNGTIN